jgi:hypothetical protein
MVVLRGNLRPVNGRLGGNCFEPVEIPDRDRLAASGSFLKPGLFGKLQEQEYV